MDKSELLKNMRELKQNIEKSNSSSNYSIKVEDMLFYGRIEIKDPATKMMDSKNIYSVQKREGNELSIEFYADDDLIATVKLDKENRIEISDKYSRIITPETFLLKMQELKENEKEQISLEKLEEMEEEKEIGQSKKRQVAKPKENKKEQNEDNEESKKDEKQDNKQKEVGKDDIEIDMDKYITADKKISDLIPEISQKQCEQVKIRSNNNIDFEMYGIDKDGNEVELESLKKSKGNNPNQEMIKTNADGSEVERTRVSTMLNIAPQKNETRGEEGIGIKIGEMGVEEVLYYRRDLNNQYLAIPVSLETTNEKYVDRDVRDIATKKFNTEVGDDVQRAETELERKDETQIENIDNDPRNNEIDSQDMELISEAAQRCRLDVEEFLKVYENSEGDSVEEKIDNAEETVNEQFRGRNNR